MKNFDIADVAELAKPYYNIIKEVQEEGFKGTVMFKDMLIEKGIPIVMKPRSKGSLMSDCIKTHLETRLCNDPNAKIVEMGGWFGLMLHNRILIRFNKMDEKFKSSIQKRKGYRAFVNQGEELEGFNNEVIKIWAGFIPIDKQWSDIARYFLVCYDAGRVIWFNNLDDNYTVEQLSIDITPPKSPRRTKLKNKEDNNNQETKTGTDNI